MYSIYECVGSMIFRRCMIVTPYDDDDAEV